MPSSRFRSLAGLVPSSPRGWLAAAFVVSFLLRAILVVLRGTWHADYSSTDIGQIAVNIAEGRGFLFMDLPSSFFGPVFLYLWAFALRIGGEYGQLAIQILQAAVLSAASLCLYPFARLRFGVRASLCGAWILALYPELLVLPTTMYADTLALFLWCACLALYATAVRSAPGAIGPALALGVCAGLTVLTKGRLLVFTALLLPFLAAGDPATLRGVLRPRPGGLRSAVVAAIALATVLAPWAVRNHRVHGEVLLLESSSGLNLWMGHNENATGTGKVSAGLGGAADPFEGGSGDTGFPRSPELREALGAAGTEMARDHVLRDEALRWIRENPAREIPLSFRKVLYFWTIDPTSTVARSPAYWAPWAIVLALATAGVLRRRARGMGDPLPMSLLLVATVLAVAFFVIPRLRYPVYPIVFLLAGEGLAALLAAVRGEPAAERSA